MSGHILLVEDDENLATVVLGYLRRNGLTTQWCPHGLQARSMAEYRRPDVVILDRMLPGLDGLEVCAQLREVYPTLPVIMVTALGEEEDRIGGLVAGADDYLTKPFSPRELVLRVQALLRRSQVGATSRDTVSCGGLTLEHDGRRVVGPRGAAELTAREGALLSHLLRHPHQAFSRAQLLRQVWGWSVGDQSTVTVHIRRLREKVEDDPANPLLLRTVWGVGYEFVPPHHVEEHNP